MYKVMGLCLFQEIKFARRRLHTTCRNLKKTHFSDKRGIEDTWPENGNGWSYYAGSKTDRSQDQSAYVRQEYLKLFAIW